MAQQENYWTEQRFADYLRGNFQDQIPSDQSNKDLVEGWLATHPQDRSLMTPGQDDGEGRGWFTTGVTTAARVIPAVIGCGIGGAAGSFGGGVAVPGVGTIPGGIAGCMVGGGIGGGIGDSIAQTIEKLTGRREEFSGKQLATETALGAIPVTKLRGASRLAQVAGEAGKGGVIGGGSSIALQKVYGEPIDWSQVGVATGIGTGLGAAGGTFLTRGKVPTELQPSQYSDAAHVRLQATRAANASRVVDPTPTSPVPGIKVAETGAKGKWERAAVKLQDTFREGRSFIERIAKHSGLNRGEFLDPTEYSDLQRGAVGGRWNAYQRAVDDIKDKAYGADLLKDVTYYLDLKGMKHGGATLGDKIRNLYAPIKERATRQVQKDGKWVTEQYWKWTKGDAKGAEKLIEKLYGGKALPEGYTPPSVTKAFLKFKRTFIADNGPDRWAELVGYGEQMFDVNRQSLELMRDSGFISNKVYNIFVKRGENGDHIPLNRFLEAMTDTQLKGLKQGKTPLHALEGSEKTTLDPWSAVKIRHRSVLLASVHNNSKRAMIRARDINEDFAGMMPEIKKDWSNPDLLDGYSAMRVWIKGEERMFQLPTGVVAGLESLDQHATSILGDIGIAFTTKFTQRLATSLNLAFSFTNVPRDVSDVMLLRNIVTTPRQFAAFSYDWASAAAQMGIRELADMMRPVLKTKAMQNLFGQGILDLPEVRLSHSTRKMWADQNADYATFQRAGLDPRPGIPGEFARSIPDRLGSGLLVPVDFALGPVGRISNVLEESTKLAAFNTLTRRGITGTERAIRTRRFGGSPDFGVRGEWAQTAGNAILFFNAQMQGITRNARSLTDLLTGKDLKTKEGRQALLSVFLPIATLEVMRQKNNLMYTDPDGTPAVDRITDSDHENYWTWVLPDLETTDEGIVRHKRFKISKGHMGRVLFNPLQDVLRAAADPTRPIKPTQTFLNLITQFSPGSLKLELSPDGKFLDGRKLVDGIVSSTAPWIKAPAELMMNRNTFSGFPLESMGQQAKDPSQRQNIRTSPTLSRITKSIAESGGPEISPIQAQQVYENFMPGGGEWIRTAADKIASGEPVAPAIAAGAWEPLARRFKGSSADQRQRDMQDTFYHELKRSEQATTTLRALNVENPTEAQRYRNQNADRLARTRQLRRIRERLNNVENYPDLQQGPERERILLEAMNIIEGTATAQPTSGVSNTDMMRILGELQKTR